ncbi:MAG: hypothetical protein QJR02_01830 [Sinobacteraceae bacterium]|nr:hypothetical protein [Nevskiaceae bacterium]
MPSSQGNELEQYLLFVRETYRSPKLSMDEMLGTLVGNSVTDDRAFQKWRKERGGGDGSN